MARFMIQIIPFKFPGISKVKCIFTTRKGGYSRGRFSSANLSFDVGDNITSVKKNREDIEKQLKINKLIELKQVHGSKLICLDNTKDLEQFSLEGDAVITSKKNLALMIKTADCQPILVCDKTGSAIGGFHVGWRANRGEFIKQWIDAFCNQYNLNPDHVVAVRGPSLCPEHSEFVNFNNEFPNKFKKYFNPETKKLNLWDITYDQLRESGLPEKNIYRIDLCTYCLDELFYSYRRDKICGRQGNIIWICY